MRFLAASCSRAGRCCGQKGPLYLRDSPPPGIKPAKPKPYEPSRTRATRAKKRSRPCLLPIATACSAPTKCRWTKSRAASAPHASSTPRRRSRRVREFAQALKGRDAQICYSVKANSNLAILALLARLGARLRHRLGRRAGARLAAAASRARRCFPASARARRRSASRWRKASAASTSIRGGARARRRRGARARLARPIAFRVNPDIDAKTHPYISTGLRETKFGVRTRDAERSTAGRGAARRRAGRHRLPHRLAAAGPAPFVAAAERLIALVDRLERKAFTSSTSMSAAASASATRMSAAAARSLRRRRDAALGPRRTSVIFDPAARWSVMRRAPDARRVCKAGRARRFLVVDTAMNDLIRRALRRLA
jgi:diaminopimelate decarboxylase